MIWNIWGLQIQLPQTKYDIIYRCDFTVDDLQIINAATHGASAITLSGEMTDDLKAQIEACKKYNVEPLVMIKTAEEGKNSIIHHYSTRSFLFILWFLLIF